jgi:prepilin-type N-terminal cleavage/methylation domain-containing protein
MNSKGFVLIELLMVLAVFLLLTGGLYYTYLNNKQPTITTGFKAEEEAGTIVQNINQQTQQQQSALNQTTGSSSDEFPIPPMYEGYVWSNASSSSYEAISISTALNNFSPRYLRGQLYEATNTEPGAIEWRKMIEVTPKDQPQGFYGGDGLFLDYYNKVLRADGYQTSSFNLDKNLIVSNSGNAMYTISPMSADGPHGTIGVYMKYSNGEIRAIIISSSDTKNQVFISDVVGFKTLMPSQ